MGDGRSLAQLLRADLSLLSFSSQMKNDDPVTAVCQVSETRSKKPSMETQRGLNLNGIGPKFSLGDSERDIGL